MKRFRASHFLKAFTYVILVYTGRRIKLWEANSEHTIFQTGLLARKYVLNSRSNDYVKRMVYVFEFCTR